MGQVEFYDLSAIERTARFFRLMAAFMSQS